MTTTLPIGFGGFVLVVFAAIAAGFFLWLLVLSGVFAIRRYVLQREKAQENFLASLRRGPLELFEAVPSVWKAVVTFISVMRHVISELLPRCRWTVITQQAIVIAVAALPYLNSQMFGLLIDKLGEGGQVSAVIIVEVVLLMIVTTWWLCDLLEKKLTYSLDQHFRQMFVTYFPRIRERCGMESFQAGEAFRTLAKAEQGEYFVKFFVVFSMSLIGGLFGSLLGAVTVLPNISAEPRLLLALTLLAYLVIRLHSAMKMSLFEDSNYKKLGEMTTIKNSFSRKEFFKGLVAFGITASLIRRAERLSAQVFGPQRSLNWKLTSREAVAMLILIGACAFSGHLLIADSFSGNIPIGRVAFLVGSMIALIRSLKTLIEGFGLQILGIQKMDNLTRYLRNPDAVIAPLGGPVTFEATGPLGIEVTNLTYTYPGAPEPSLRELSFTIPAGQIAFIQAGNGVGKTSFYNLLGHLYRVPEAGIFLVTEDGRRFDVATLDTNLVRRLVRHLGQSTLEMKYTIRETLAMVAGLDENSREANARKTEAIMWRALRCARLSGRVRKFRKKLDETLQVFHDAREDLSGGQHRKLNVAMMFMAMFTGGAKILILDEPFTGVEPQDAKAILLNFRDHAKRLGSTLLVTTHAMSEVPNTAWVLAMYRLEDHARKLLRTEVETGTHGNLMQSSGRYARYSGCLIDMTDW